MNKVISISISCQSVWRAYSNA